MSGLNTAVSSMNSEPVPALHLNVLATSKTVLPSPFTDTSLAVETATPASQKAPVDVNFSMPLWNFTSDSIV